MAYVKQATWIEYGPGPVAPRPAMGSAIARNGAAGRISPRPAVRAIGSRWRRRGVGATGTMDYDAYCNTASLWDPAAWSICLPHDFSKVGSKLFGSGSLPAPPPPPPPNIALVSASAAAGNSAAVYAGVDSSGAAVYAVPQSADANMAAYAATVQQFMTDVGNANPPPDCSSAWNQFTNSSCGGSWLPILAGLGLVGAFVFLGRRR